MANKGTRKLIIGGQPFGDYTDIIKGEPIGGGPNVVDLGGYGRPDVTFVNLASRKIIRRMTMTREHANNQQSWDWYQTASQIWSGQANVLDTHMDYTGTESSYLITGAEIQIEVDEPIGPTTMTKITITGGQAVKQ